MKKYIDYEYSDGRDLTKEQIKSFLIEYNYSFDEEYLVFMETYSGKRLGEYQILGLRDIMFFNYAEYIFKDEGSFNFESDVFDNISDTVLGSSDYAQNKEKLDKFISEFKSHFLPFAHGAYADLYYKISDANNKNELFLHEVCDSGRDFDEMFYSIGISLDEIEENIEIDDLYL